MYLVRFDNSLLLREFCLILLDFGKAVGAFVFFVECVEFLGERGIWGFFDVCLADDGAVVCVF